MKYHSNSCSICGTVTSKLKVGVLTTGNHSPTQILLLWKRQCINSLCDILFDSKCPDLFKEYFNEGMLCPDCLQIIRDVDFTWKQLMEFKRQVKEHSARVRNLLSRNYNSGNHKSEAAVIEARISGLKDSFVINYSEKEVLEMIYTVVHFKQEFAKVTEQAYTEKCTEFPTNINTVKEELMQEDNYFNEGGGGHDWHSDNAAVESDVINIMNSVKQAQLEIKYLIETQRQHSVMSQSNATEELEVQLPKEKSSRRSRRLFRSIEEEESEAEADQAQSNDEEWKPSSSIKYTPYEPYDKEITVSKRKRKQKSQKLLNDGGGSDKERSAHSNANDKNVESVVKKSGVIKFQRSGCGLRTDIVLDGLELDMLQKLSTLKCNWKQFRSFTNSERNLAFKVSQFSLESIGKLSLTEEQTNGILKLRRTILARKRLERDRPPKLRIEFPCTEQNCEAKFMKKECLEGHIREKHKGEEFPFYCTTCPKKFTKYAKVRRHRDKIHKGVKMDCSHFCNICHKGYKMEEELKFHSDGAHQGPNPFCCAFCEVEHLTSGELICHVNEAHLDITPEVSKYLHKCEICGKYMEDERSFKIHMKGHKKKVIDHSSKLFKCNRCSASFSSESSLNIHFEGQHTETICDICGKSVNKKNLPKHMDRHSGILKFECKLCSKRFKTQGLLSDHERIHSGIRSFICSVCGKGFYTKNILHGHEKTHEPGYIPRKPIRRTRPNRKKKFQPQTSVSESSNNSDALPLLDNQQNETFQDHHQDLIINNSITVPQPQFLNHKYAIDHTLGYLYHSM